MIIDFEKMKKTCLRPIDSFLGFGEVTQTPDGIYIHKDNGSQVLAVCHLDTVLNTDHFHKVEVNGDTVVINAQLDDRLGAYALLYLLPSMGLNYDILLTEGEEKGRSTAAYFETAKQYNWMFSFDRRGSDVVLYQYESKKIKKALGKSGFKVGIGSFSDICDLETLGVKGFNVGTGYHGEHSDMCYASMTEFESQVKRFAHFHKANQDRLFSHDAYASAINSPYSMNGWEYSDRNTFKAYDDLYCYLCNETRGKHEIKPGVYLCDTCNSNAGVCSYCLDIVYDHHLMNNVCTGCRAFTGED